MSLQESIKKIRTLPELNSNNFTLHSMTLAYPLPASFFLFVEQKEDCWQYAVCTLYSIGYCIIKQNSMELNCYRVHRITKIESSSVSSKFNCFHCTFAFLKTHNVWGVRFVLFSKRIIDSFFYTHFKTFQ